jgi:hypothetical protein
MKKLLAITACASLLAVWQANAFQMNFEEGLGNDRGLINGIPGVTFLNSVGDPWLYTDITTGNYNAHSVDLNLNYGNANYYMYGKVAAWAGEVGQGGRIDFDDQNGTWFQTGFCSYSNFYLDAYDAGGNWLDGAYSPGGLYQFGYLRVDAPAGSTIAYVTLHDSGNYWIVDEMSGDMQGGIETPEGGMTLALLGFACMGLFGVGRKVRK